MSSSGVAATQDAHASVHSTRRTSQQSVAGPQSAHETSQHSAAGDTPAVAWEEELSAANDAPLPPAALTHGSVPCTFGSNVEENEGDGDGTMEGHTAHHR